MINPAQIAERYAGIAGEKCKRSTLSVLALGVLAGAYVALACVATHVVTTLIDAPVSKLVASLLFPAGLGMILVGGGELFTGNCMLPLAVQCKEITPGQLLRNWGVVYLGNFIGALLIAWLSVAARRGDAAFLSVAVATAEGKMAATPLEALLRGVLCNFLVCAAVWMSYAAENATGKIVTMYFPVALFVLCGTEHCVANMYYFLAAWIAGGSSTLSAGRVLLGNLLPVTIGNVLGGGVLFSGLVWLALFTRRTRDS